MSGPALGERFTHLVIAPGEPSTLYASTFNTLLARLQAAPDVRVNPHIDSPLVRDATRRAVARGGSIRTRRCCEPHVEHELEHGAYRLQKWSSSSRHTHYRSSGYLWQDRCADHLLTIFSYILKSPVRTEIVEHVIDRPWSSLRFPELAPLPP